jgi:hypothetical protein
VKLHFRFKSSCRYMSHPTLFYLWVSALYCVLFCLIYDSLFNFQAISFEVKRVEVRDAERLEKEAGWAAELATAKTETPLDYPAVASRIKKLKEKEAAREKQWIRKQDKLLFVAFYILLNLAEDLNVERKMIKNSLIPSIAVMLSRNFEDLLILCVTFLKKLSTIDENKDCIRELNIVDKLVRFISCSSEPLILITLRCLYNLCFDKVSNSAAPSFYVIFRCCMCA